MIILCQLQADVFAVFFMSELTNLTNAVVRKLGKKSLKIPKEQSESVYRITDNTMAKGKSTGQTTIYKTYI